jgi:hypothetical protein
VIYSAKFVLQLEPTHVNGGLNSETFFAAMTGFRGILQRESSIQEDHCGGDMRTYGCLGFAFAEPVIVCWPERDFATYGTLGVLDSEDGLVRGDRVFYYGIGPDQGNPLRPDTGGAKLL